MIFVDIKHSPAKCQIKLLDNETSIARKVEGLTLLRSLFSHRRMGLALVLSMACFMLVSQSVFAWTWRENNWDSNPNDYQCGNTSSTPCLYWPEPGHVSSSIYAYFYPSLNNVGGYNFTTAVQRALNDFNNAPALNPYVYSCTNATGCLDSTSYSIGDLGYAVYGQTPYGTIGAIQHSSQYYSVMSGNGTIFNSSRYISWNNNLVFSATQADGRKVATHETGHMEGLGHTSHNPAIMRQGTVTYYALQTDDINGLSSQYNGNIPAQ